MRTATTIADLRQRCQLGIQGIDEEHLALLGLVEELGAAADRGHARKTTGAVLDKLVAYARVHFGHEERLLQSHQYPELEKHRGEHDKFTRRLVEFLDDHHRSGSDITTEMRAYLSDWIAAHILESDKKYAEYLRKRGVK